MKIASFFKSKKGKFLVSIASLLILSAGLVASVDLVQKRQTLKNRAANDSSLTDNEMKIIRAIVKTYLSPNPSFDEMANYTYHAYPNETDGITRTLCNLSMASFLDKKSQNIPISSTDRDFQLLLKAIENISEVESWIVAVPYYQCLWSANLAKETFSTSPELRAKLDVFLRKAVAMASLISEKYTVSKFKELQSWNVGNSQAEEAGWTAAFLASVSSMMSDAHISSTTKEKYKNQADDLLEYMYSCCGKDKDDDTGKYTCPYRTTDDGKDKYLLANHLIDPHPVYTQSALTVSAELKTLNNQTNAGLNNLPDSTYIENAASALKKYVKSNFTLTGEYRELESHWKLIVKDTKSFDNAIYTIFDSIVPSPNSIDTSSIQFKNNQEVHYILKGDRIWKYTCHNGTCTANFTNTLDQLWSGLKNHQAYGNHPLPTSDIDVLSQFYNPDGSLSSYVLKGDRVWKYTCHNGTCTANFTKTLNKLWPKIKNSEIYSVSLPNRNIDSINQYYNGNILYTRIIKDDMYWVYTCQNGSCNAVENDLLAKLFNSIRAQKNWGGSKKDSYHGVCDWGFDAALQNEAYAYMADASPNQLNRYKELQKEQLLVRRLGDHPYFYTSFENGQWGWDKPTYYKVAYRTHPLLDSIYESDQSPTPNPIQILNSHTFFNALAAYNHSVAYLMLSDKGLLEKFSANTCEENLLKTHLWEGDMATIDHSCDYQTKKHGGTSLRIASSQPANVEGYSPLIDVKPNTTYKVSYWVKTEDLQVISAKIYGKIIAAQYNASAKESDKINQNRIDAGFNLGENISGKNNWLKKSYTFTTNPNTKYVRLRALLGGDGTAQGTAWYDQIIIAELNACKESNGDIDNNGKIDVSDFSLFIMDYGKEGEPGQIKGDLNCDGKVDISDLSILLANYKEGF